MRNENILNKKVTYKKVPIYAGMPFGKQGDCKMKIVGYDKIMSTWNVYEDGDEVLVDQKRIKRILKAI